MILKPRTKPSELLTLEYLNTRMTLSPKDKLYYLSLKKGFEGEKNFDLWTEKLQCECIILNDLLLKVNNTTFQIDALIITADKTYLYEVKNFEGEYIFDPRTNKFFIIKSKQEIINPLHQLERCESLLNQLMLKHSFNPTIKGDVVFINDEFTLYQAPPDEPIIFLSQLNKHFKQLNAISAPLSRHHFLLAEKLQALHITDPSYKQIPSYNYEQLHKGITCRKCNSFSIRMKKISLSCKTCGYEEAIAEAVMQMTKEYQLLFPEKKVTASAIQDWCQVVKSKRTIANILAKNLSVKGKYRWTHYV
ncbi:nuclease-related domain-containing protein [Virgibacillus kimchii]